MVAKRSHKPLSDIFESAKCSKKNFIFWSELKDVSIHVGLSFFTPWKFSRENLPGKKTQNKSGGEKIEYQGGPNKNQLGF